MDVPFETVWAEIRAALSRREYPCIHTLKDKTRNDVLSILETGIELRSHDKRSKGPRTIEKSVFRKWWSHLIAQGTASLKPGTRKSNNPVAKHSKIIGAIWATCLPNRIEYIRETDTIRLRARTPPLPEEIPDPTGLTEGAVRRIPVNAYERDATARRLCIAAHGTDCCICGFRFGAAYGPEAEGVIHVHHLRPLSEIGGEYTVDPVEDLRPVCPNCHAVLHLGGRCRSIEEVRRMLRR